MSTGYSTPASTLDRPYGPGEFARYAEQASPGVIDQDQYMAPAPEVATNFSTHPNLQAEAARQAAASLALSSHEFHVPQGQGYEYANDVHNEAVAATLTGGVENMLSSSDREPSAAEINARFDEIATQERARDAMAPRPEAQYSENGATLEVYRAGLAVTAVRNARLQGPENN